MTASAADKAHRIVFKAGRVELNGIVLQGRFADLISCSESAP